MDKSTTTQRRRSRGLTDLAIDRAKPREKPYELADGRGLVLEVLPGGSKSWRFRYRSNGKRGKVTLGNYPEMTLHDARDKLVPLRRMVANGGNPALAKKEEKARGLLPNTVAEFAEAWFREIVTRNVKDTSHTRRYLDRDILPAIGMLRVDEVTPAHTLSITDRRKAKGHERSALQLHGDLCRLFDYAIARQLSTSNPARAIKARYVGVERARNRYLAVAEAGTLLRGIERSGLATALKDALGVLLRTGVRRSDLVTARWEQIDFSRCEWTLPMTKNANAYIIPLPPQVLALFSELKALAGNSEWVLPGQKESARSHISRSTLNKSLQAANVGHGKLDDIRLHDFRRTISTAMTEAGWPPEVIEVALQHEIKGVRGVYAKVQYLDQRRKMLAQWNDMLDAAMANASKVVTGKFSRTA